MFQINEFDDEEDSVISIGSSSCASSSVMQKIEECNRELLEMINMDETFANNKISELSQKLSLIQNELLGTIGKAEKNEARRQFSEFELARSIKVNRYLKALCSKYHHLLKVNEAALTETKNEYEKSLTKNAENLERLQNERMEIETTLKNRNTSLANEQQKLVAMISRLECDMREKKDENQRLKREISKLTQQVSDFDSNTKNQLEHNHRLLRDSERVFKERIAQLEEQLSSYRLKEKRALDVFQQLKSELFALPLMMKTTFSDLTDRLSSTENSLVNLAHQLRSYHHTGSRIKNSSEQPLCVRDQTCYNQLIKIYKLLESYSSLSFTKQVDSYRQTAIRECPPSSDKFVSTRCDNLCEQQSHGEFGVSENPIERILDKLAICLDFHKENREKSTQVIVSDDQKESQTQFQEKQKRTRRSRSVKHGSTEQRCARCEHSHPSEDSCLIIKMQQAIHEVNRWRRRWKQERLALQLERQRVAALQDSLKVDKKMKNTFLKSVCSLIHEASRQIDHVVSKNLKRFSHAASPNSNVKGGQRSVKHSSPVRLSRHTDRLETRSDGDKPESESSSVDQLVTPTNRGSYFDMQLHTNCNNNVGISCSSTTGQLNDPSYCGNSVHSLAVSGSYMWSDNNLEAQELSVMLSENNCDEDDLEDGRSEIYSVATTSDPFEADSKAELDPPNRKRFVTGDGLMDNNIPDVASTDENEKAESVGDRLMGSSACPAANVTQEDIEARRWLEFRSAVRFELGRVMGSVVNHAKQDDTLAKECLDAILDLQKKLINDVPVTPVSNENQIASDEIHSLYGKEKVVTAVRHQSNAICMVRKESSVISKPGSDHMSPIQISIPLISPESLTEATCTEVVKCSTLTKTQCLQEIPDVSPLSDPLPAPKLTRSTNKRSHCMKRRESRKCAHKAEWKFVGGVIHPPKISDSEPLGHCCKARRQETGKRQGLTDEAKMNCLPVISNRRILHNIKSKDSTNVTAVTEETADKNGESPNQDSTDKMAARSCILPPLNHSQGSVELNSRRGNCRAINGDKPVSIDSTQSTGLPSANGHLAVQPRANIPESAPRTSYGESKYKANLRTHRERQVRVLRPVPSSDITGNKSTVEQANSNNSSTGISTPSSVQWVELDDTDFPRLPSRETRFGHKQRACCCGSSCCLMRPAVPTVSNS